MKILTANSLADGAVVYRTEDGAWSERLVEAERFTSPERAEAALAEAAAAFRTVVGAYLIEADEKGLAGRERLKETIRAGGPTVGHSIGWQAVAGA
jgi:hypothetical protein